MKRIADQRARSGGLVMKGRPGFNRNRGLTLLIERSIGADRRAIPYGEREPVEVPEFEEGRSYTRRQLTLMGEALLREQHLSGELDAHEHPYILLWEMQKNRYRREIYVGNGIPDPSLVSGIYWRSHPGGRKVNSDEQRAKGAAYYR